MNKNILFFDTNLESINQLKKELTTLSNEINIEYASTVHEAVEKLEQSKINFLFVDDVCKSIDLVQFLDRVKKEFPSVIRIIYADSTDKQHGARLSQLYHRITSKPVSSENVNNIITNLNSLKKYILNEKIIDVINNISELPTLPDTYIKLENALAAENVSMHKIGEIITKDMAFTTKVLQIVNSSFFGLQKKVTLPSQAVNYLGRNVLKSLLLYHKLYLSIKIDDKLKSFFEKMWIHSNKVGRFAEELIHQAYYDDIEMMEDAYISGLLHDIGKLVMLSVPEYPHNVFDLMKEKQIRYSQAEYELYDVSHSDVAAYFLALWGLPERIVEAVYSHKRDSKIDFSKFTIPNAVYIANLLATDLDLELKDLKNLRLGALPNDWLKYIEENS